jgi:hypothetical protein
VREEEAPGPQDERGRRGRGLAKDDERRGLDTEPT